MKIGLKLWSKNTGYYFNAAKKLFVDGWFDYIELYVAPGTIHTIKKWQTLDIPFTLHAPHFDSGANLAIKEKEQLNIKLYEEVKQFNEALNAEYVVVHGGIEGDIKETTRQLKIINLKNLLIENKPHQAPTDPEFRCRGAQIEEIKYVLDELGCGFCLDIGHAICTSNSFSLNPYEYLAEFNKLNPTCYHLCDNKIDSDIDNHMHFGDGSYDLKMIFKIINLNKNIAIETCKNKQEDLDDFINDIKLLRQVVL